jgi:hypothetical protein
MTYDRVNQQKLYIMAKNSKPILSVLIEEDKRTKFADLARRHSLSMGWLVNQAIDRMIDSDSIDIYRDSIGSIPSTPITTSIDKSIESIGIEGIIKTSVEDYLLNNSIGYVSRVDVEKVFSESIDNYLKSESIDSLSKGDIEKLINDSIEKRMLDTGAIEKLVIAQIEPLTASLVELETYTQNQIKAVREELKKPLAIVR